MENRRKFLIYAQSHIEKKKKIDLHEDHLLTTNNLLLQ
jgi:hypothetical protein